MFIFGVCLLPWVVLNAKNLDEAKLLSELVMNSRVMLIPPMRIKPEPISQSTRRAARLIGFIWAPGPE